MFQHTRVESTGRILWLEKLLKAIPLSELDVKSSESEVFAEGTIRELPYPAAGPVPLAKVRLCSYTGSV